MKGSGEVPTKSVLHFFQGKQVDRTRNALEKNGFETQFVPDAQSAVTGHNTGHLSPRKTIF
jgi:hypothetical protein